MDNKIKVGITGAGVFGSYHAAKYDALEDAVVSGVYDTHFSRAQTLAAKYGAQPFEDYFEFLQNVDAVVVAAPASSHFMLAEAALKHDCHVFVEKPLALTIEAADALIAMADQRKLALQVGHQERYVCEAVGLLDREQKPLRIECVRQSPFTGRCGDVSAVFDLMVHDLDIIRHLTHADLVSHNAEGDAEDIAAELFLDNGTLASLSAGRRAKSSKRTMTIFYEDGVIDFDFVHRRLTNSTPAVLHDAFNSKSPHLALQDPLALGAQLFIDAIKNKKTPVISGSHARSAVLWAQKIEQAAGISNETVVRKLRA